MASEEISQVSYEDLAELEKDFDEVEAQISGHIRFDR
jgi:hypothetical protein